MAPPRALIAASLLIVACLAKGKDLRKWRQRPLGTAAWPGPPCAAGYTQPTAQSTYCSICDGGTYTATAGTVGPCTPYAGTCDAGSFEPEGATADGQCALCEPGSWTPPTNGLTYCISCDFNTFASAAGATACTSCAAGTATCAWPSGPCLDGQASCFECPVDYYSSSGGNCAPCGAGTTTYGRTGQTSCFEACPAGTSFITDQNTCVECAAGSFAAAGDAACTPCPAGSASSVTGATSASACELCGGGSYSSVPGAAACTSCAAAFPDVTTIKPATSACFPNTITTCDPTGHFAVAHPQKLPPYVGATSAAACCCVGSPQLCKAYEGLPGGWACPAFGCPGEAPPTADTSAVACSQDSLCSDYVSLTWLQAPFGATTGNPLVLKPGESCPSPPPPLAA